VRRLVLLLVALAALALPVAASAHPLGNFTVNRFSRIEVSGARVYVLYVLDMAEIPTFQAGKIDAHAYARRIARGLTLTVDGRLARLAPGGIALAHPRGAGGLPTSTGRAASSTATATSPTGSAGKRSWSVGIRRARAGSSVHTRRTSSKAHSTSPLSPRDWSRGLTPSPCRR
jgi:hypothetical protein